MLTLAWLLPSRRSGRQAATAALIGANPEGAVREHSSAQFDSEKWRTLAGGRQDSAQSSIRPAFFDELALDISLIQRNRLSGDRAEVLKTESTSRAHDGPQQGSAAREG
jgi:hypothetical protein